MDNLNEWITAIKIPLSIRDVLVMFLAYPRTCQFSCKYCYAQWNPGLAEVRIDESLWQGLIQQIAAFSKKQSQGIRLSLAGGEPLLERKLPEIMAYAKDLGLELSLITNGHLLVRTTITSPRTCDFTLLNCHNKYI